MQYTKAGAEFSDCGLHRIHLWREWDDPKAHMADEDTPLSFTVGALNPSIAGIEDDPSVRRMVGFAMREGFRRLDLFNLSTRIATDPKDMLRHIASEDEATLQPLCDAIEVAGQFVAAWGANVSKSYDLRRRANHVAHFASNRLPDGPMCWGMTKAGHPKHPLYLAKDTPLVPFKV